MAKSKHCPNCGAKTKTCVFSSKIVVVTNLSGEVLRDGAGQPRRGYATRKCRRCTWQGDVVLLPAPAPVAAKTTYFDDLDDYDEDYINHYYH